jgi:hypothetical protein
MVNSWNGPRLPFLAGKDDIGTFACCAFFALRKVSHLSVDLSVCVAVDLSRRTFFDRKRRLLGPWLVLELLQDALTLFLELSLKIKLAIWFLSTEPDCKYLPAFVRLSVRLLRRALSGA